MSKETKKENKSCFKCINFTGCFSEHHAARRKGVTIHIENCSSYLAKEKLYSKHYFKEI